MIKVPGRFSTFSAVENVLHLTSYYLCILSLMNNSYILNHDDNTKNGICKSYFYSKKKEKKNNFSDSPHKYFRTQCCTVS